MSKKSWLKGYGNPREEYTPLWELLNPFDWKSNLPVPVPPKIEPRIGSVPKELPQPSNAIIRAKEPWEKGTDVLDFEATPWGKASSAIKGLLGLDILERDSPNSMWRNPENTFGLANPTDAAVPITKFGVDKFVHGTPALENIVKEGVDLSKADTGDLLGWMTHGARIHGPERELTVHGNPWTDTATNYFNKYALGYKHRGEAGGNIPIKPQGNIIDLYDMPDVEDVQRVAGLVPPDVKQDLIEAWRRANRTPLQKKYIAREISTGEQVSKEFDTKEEVDKFIENQLKYFPNAKQTWMTDTVTVGSPENNPAVLPATMRHIIDRMDPSTFRRTGAAGVRYWDAGKEAFAVDPLKAKFALTGETLPIKNKIKVYDSHGSWIDDFDTLEEAQEAVKGYGQYPNVKYTISDKPIDQALPYIVNNKYNETFGRYATEEEAIEGLKRAKSESSWGPFKIENTLDIKPLGETGKGGIWLKGLSEEKPLNWRSIGYAGNTTGIEPVTEFGKLKLKLKNVPPELHHFGNKLTGWSNDDLIALAKDAKKYNIDPKDYNSINVLHEDVNNAIGQSITQEYLKSQPDYQHLTGGEYWVQHELGNLIEEGKKYNINPKEYTSWDSFRDAITDAKYDAKYGPGKYAEDIDSFSDTAKEVLEPSTSFKIYDDISSNMGAGIDYVDAVKKVAPKYTEAQLKGALTDGYISNYEYQLMLKTKDTTPLMNKPTKGWKKVKGLSTNEELPEKEKTLDELFEEFGGNKPKWINIKNKYGEEGMHYKYQIIDSNSKPMKGFKTFKEAEDWISKYGEEGDELIDLDEFGDVVSHTAKGDVINQEYEKLPMTGNTTMDIYYINKNDLKPDAKALAQDSEDMKYLVIPSEQSESGGTFLTNEIKPEHATDFYQKGYKIHLNPYYNAKITKKVLGLK